MKFAHPEFLYALPILWAAIYFGYRRGAQRRRRLLERFAGESGSWMEIGASQKRRRLDRFCFGILVTALVATLARPLYFAADDRSELQGAPYLICLDASRSMLASDVEPTRYSAATYHLDRFLAETKSDHIGLITFAGVAYMNAPLTFDMTALRTILSYVDPTAMNDPGSSIASALDRAGRFFRSNSIPERTVVLISDGEDLEGKAIALARKLHQDERVTIHALGIGTRNGAPIPATRNDTFATNAAGRQIVSKLDEANLRRIANAAGGTYRPIGNNGEGLRQLRAEVLEPLAEKLARNDLQNYHEAYYAPLAIAIIALLTRILVSADRVLRRKPLPSILNAR